MSIKGVQPSCHLMCLFTLELQITFTVSCVYNWSGNPDYNASRTKESLLTYLQLILQDRPTLEYAIAQQSCFSQVCRILTGGFSTSMTSNYFMVLISQSTASEHAYLLLLLPFPLCLMYRSRRTSCVCQARHVQVH